MNPRKTLRQRIDILVILGMHRSGTSAVARVCNLLGAELGTQLMPPIEGNNPAGFWELEEVARIHDELLGFLDLCWHETGEFPHNWWESPCVIPFKDRLIEVLGREVGNSTLGCLKDPRVCRLAPLWIDIFKQLSWTPHYLLVIRNPLEVAESLQARDGFSSFKSSLLWLRHVFEAERYTRGKTRAFISYDDLLNDWRATMVPAWRRLGLGDLKICTETTRKIENFLKTDLRHHTAKAPDIEDEKHTLIAAVYKHYLSAIKADNLHMQTALSTLEESFGRTAVLFEPLVKAEASKRLQLEAERHSLNAQNRSLQERISAATMKIEQLRQEGERLKREDERLRQESGWLRQENAQHIDEIGRLTQHIAEREGTIAALLASTSWRVTAPLRGAKFAVQRLTNGLGMASVSSARWLFRRLPLSDQNKLRLRSLAAKRMGPVLEKVQSSAGLAQNRTYAEWISRYDVLTESDRAEIRRHIALLKRKPLISVVMPVFNTPERFLRSAIQSVVDQLYDHWELCIADDCSTEPHVVSVIREYQAKDERIKAVFREENGHISACSNSALALTKGEFIALMDHDDVLREHALYRVVLTINQSPDADLIYSDEDKIDDDGMRSSPYFKSGWNPDLFCAQNMISHLGVYRAGIVRDVGGFRVGFEGSQDYDLALRVIEQTSPAKIVHIPHVLYHWRHTASSSSFSQRQLQRAVAAAQRAVSEHLERIGVDAMVEPAPGAEQYQRIRRAIPKPAPLVSLIIPTRDKSSLLRQCVDGILSRTDYPAIEVIIVNNGSVERETHEYLRAIQADLRVRVIDYDCEFNYSAINNFAIRQAKGEVVGLINNDVVVINKDWLTELISHAVRPEVGAVGAMLYYPDDTVQHAGIISGLGGIAGHGHRHFRRGDPGYFGRLVLTQNVSGVTGACLLTRREVFEECGGLDEDNLGVAFNDVDLCLKIRQRGYLIVWTPYAQLYHLESASRGTDVSPDKIERFKREITTMQLRWGTLLLEDPYYNPNLSLDKPDFSLSFPPRSRRPRDGLDGLFHFYSALDN
jgi:glycosyltransferase involved in cell wall biosynthesis